MISGDSSCLLFGNSQLILVYINHVKMAMAISFILRELRESKFISMEKIQIGLTGLLMITVLTSIVKKGHVYLFCCLSKNDIWHINWNRPCCHLRSSSTLTRSHCKMRSQNALTSNTLRCHILILLHVSNTLLCYYNMNVFKAVDNLNEFVKHYLR